MGLPDLFYNIALTNTAGGWLSLGINLILSTLIGGIVILIVVGILGKKWGESLKLVNAFFIVFIINIINIIGIGGFLATIIPMGTIVFTFFVWLILIKIFFSEMPWKHAFITSIIGYVLSIFLIPYLVGYFYSLIPVNLP